MHPQTRALCKLLSFCLASCCCCTRYPQPTTSSKRIKVGVLCSLLPSSSGSMLREGMVGGEVGVQQQQTKGSTALKALATDKSSSCIVQSANLLHQLRKSSHSHEIVAKLSKDLAAKIPHIKTTGQLLEQMPSIIVALDAHLDSAFQSALLLDDVRSILLNDNHSTTSTSAVNFPMDMLQECSHSQ